MGKATGRWSWPASPPSNAEVKERVVLYIYSRSGSLWPIIRRPLPLRAYNVIEKDSVCSFVWETYCKVSTWKTKEKKESNVEVESRGVSCESGG
jgi:hypothetical protein